MKIADSINQPLATEIETTSPVKQSSRETLSETSASDHSDQAQVAHELPSSKLPKRPLDDPLFRASVSDKLGTGSGSAPSGPQIRMKDNFVDWTDDPGSDTPGEDKSIGDATEKDPNSSSHDAGINLKSHDRFEGDGHTKVASGQASGTGTNSEHELI